LTKKEQDLLIKHFLEATIEGMPTAEANKVKEAVEHIGEPDENGYEVVDSINDI
jgi:hypothetical protein